MKLDGKKAVVVGAGSGIGEAIARMAVEAGMHVVAVGRTRSKLEALGPGVEPITADITVENEVAALFERVGNFDHLLTTAADLAYLPIADFDLAAARRGLDSKVLSSMALVKHASKRLAKNGSITFTGGIASDRPMARASMVAAANAALGGLARALAIELAPIRVNVLSPGWIDTPVWDRISPDKTAAFAAMAKRLPVGRVGVPADVAHAARFLMENELTTGIVLPIDGGHRLV